MNLRDVLETIRLELCHLILGTIYFIALNSYNGYLLSKYHKDDWFKMIIENTKGVFIFLTIAVIMIVVGISLIAKKWYELRNQSLEIKDMLFKMVGIIIEVILILLTLIFIHNPILRAVLTFISFIKLMATSEV